MLRTISKAALDEIVPFQKFICFFCNPLTLFRNINVTLIKLKFQRKLFFPDFARGFIVCTVENDNFVESSSVTKISQSPIKVEERLEV